jgi:hypothetical protein
MSRMKHYRMYFYNVDAGWVVQRRGPGKYDWARLWSTNGGEWMTELYDSIENDPDSNRHGPFPLTSLMLRIYAITLLEK